MTCEPTRAAKLLAWRSWKQLLQSKHIHLWGRRLSCWATRCGRQEKAAPQRGPAAAAVAAIAAVLGLLCAEIVSARALCLFHSRLEPSHPTCRVRV